MNGIAPDINAVKMHAVVFSYGIVMIAGNINNPGALPGFLHDVVYNIITPFRPVETGLEFPQINDITNQV